ncbi:MAG: AI-2E family transporter [Bdellovibrionales bacterium]|nr:AI-2E family transporter [Bdellovibrionales bacterium]
MKNQRGVLIFLTLALLYFARTVFVPLFLALFLAILLEPVVRGLMRMRMRRAEAAILATVGFLCLAVVGGWAIYRSVSGIANEMPVYSERIRELFSGMHATTEKIEESTRTLGIAGPVNDEDVQQVQVVENVPVWARYALGWMGSLYDLATVAIFVPLLLLYLLFDRDNLLESFNAIMGRHCYLPKLNSELPKIIRAFVRGNIFTGALLIAMHGLLFRLVGLENWLPLAILSGGLNLLPLIGAPLSLLLPFAQGVIQFHEAGPFVVIGLSLIALHMVTNNLVLPYFMSSRVNVNSVTLVFGLLFWGWLWGPIGFLLAIPMTALVKTLLESNSETFALSNLFAARPRHLIPWVYRFRSTDGSARADPDDAEGVDVDEPPVGKL